MIAAAIFSGDALDRGRQIAIAVGDHGRELVDLLRRFRRRFDFDPAADAVEDGFGIERICGCQHVVCPWRIPMIVIPGSLASEAPGMTADVQPLSIASRAAICSTSSTMLRRSLASAMRVNARVSARPSEV